MMTTEKNKYFTFAGIALFLIFCGFIVSLNKRILEEAQQDPGSTVVRPTEKVGAGTPGVTASLDRGEALGTPAGVVPAEKQGEPSPASAVSPKAEQEAQVENPILLQ